MTRYLEERLQWQLAKDKENSGVANQVVGEKSRRNGAHRDGNGTQGPPSGNFRWAPSGGGRTLHPNSSRPTNLRGVFNLIEEEPRGEHQEETVARPEK